MVPQARPRIEQFLLDQMDETLKKANLMSEDQFRKFINERRPLMEKTFQELASNQKLSESSMDEIFKAMELEMGGSMQDEAINLLGTIKNTNAYWKDLSAGNDLTDEAKLERRVLQLARLLVNEATDPNKVRTAVKTYTPERRTLGAVVKSVDAGNHSLTLSVPPYKKGSVKTYKLNNDLKIHTVAGKEVSLADLKEGTRVIVTLGSDDQTVKGITARGRLDEAAPPPAKLKLTPRTGTTKTPAPAATKTQKKENSK
jgi:hypothetical protein